MKSIILTVLALATTLSFAAEPLLTDNFDRADLGKGWHVNTSDWQIVDGVLHAAEIPADKHSAAARRAIVTGDATYTLRFRLKGDAKGFHFGFDPAPGELDKKGHLFSLIIAPDYWRIMKHIDKAKPEEDPNEILAQSKDAFTPGTWYDLKLTTKGTNVTATIEGIGTLNADHPTFTVKKPTLVFRCLDGGIEIDDINVVTG